jgi:hypothetical protein
MESAEKHEIIIEYDETFESYYVIWEMAVAGLGKTKRLALSDLQKAAHLGIDTVVNSKLKTIEQEKEV